jgi:D-alanine transaminase
MTRFAYVNGRYEIQRSASVSIEDRGYQFADGVYEVIALWNSCPIDLLGHMDRLERSMAEVKFPNPPSRTALKVIAQELVRLNRMGTGILYVQINRGAAPRNHPFPGDHINCSVVMTVRHGLGPSATEFQDGVGLKVEEDLRWLRRDIKTIGLLPNVLTKQAAKSVGAFEALLVNPDGTVTEASTANIWLVGADGILVTRPLGPEVLGGITRARVMALAKDAGRKVREATFTLDEVLSAREVFLTGTTTFVLPVSKIDETLISNGYPGEVTCDLRDRYLTFLNSHNKETSWYVG